MGPPCSRIAAGALALFLLCPGSGSARAETVEEPLPFLGDGAGYPDGTPPAVDWPELRLDILAGDPAAPGVFGEDEDPVAPARPETPLFPDVLGLLLPYGEADEERGAVHVRPEREEDVDRIRALMTAVRAAYARNARVTLVVERKAGTPDAVELMRVETTTRIGAVVVEDARRDAVWPACIDHEPVLVLPVPITYRIGPRAAFTLAAEGAGRVVLNLDLHVSKATGERTFEDAARRVAPIVWFTHLRAAIPVRIGTPTRAVLGDVSVTVDVKWQPAAMPEGVRVLWLPALGGGLPGARPADSGRRWLLPSEVPKWDDVDDLRRLPVAWQTAAEQAGVRIVEVPPGLAVAEGDEEALRRFDAALAHLRTSTAHVVRDQLSGLELPCTTGSDWTFMTALVTPVAIDADAEVSQERASETLMLALDPAGRFTHGTWSDAGLAAVLTMRTLMVPDPLPHRVALTTDGGAPGEFDLDVVTATTSTRKLTLRGIPDEDESLSLADLEGWR